MSTYRPTTFRPVRCPRCGDTYPAALVVDRNGILVLPSECLSCGLSVTVIAPVSLIDPAQEFPSPDDDDEDIDPC